MGAPRTSFRRGLNDLYNYLDNEIPLGRLRSGNVFFVSNVSGMGGVNDTAHGSFDTPFSSIVYALTQALASRGDVIFVKEGHNETVSAAGGLAIATAGVSVIGLGTGRARPSISWSAAASTVLMSAANTMLRNFRLIATIADVVAGIIPSAKGVSILDCSFEDSDTDLNFLTPIKATGTTDNACDFIRMERNNWLSADAASLQFFNSAATIRGMVLNDNFAVHEGTDSALVKFATGKLFKQASIIGNFISHKMTANESLVNNDGSTNTGIIAHNRVGHADVTGAHDLGIDGLGCRLFDNLSVSTDALSGYVHPAIDVNL